MNEKNIVKIILTSPGESKSIRARNNPSDIKNILSVTGEFQVKLLANRLNRYVIDLVISNSSKRYTLTAIEVCSRQEFRPIQKVDDNILSFESIKRYCKQNISEYKTICFIVSKDEIAKLLAKLKRGNFKDNKNIKDTAVSVLEYNYIEDSCKLLVENSISHLEFKRM